MADNLRFLNPDTMAKPPGYTHVVEVTGPGRTVYFSGQLGIDKSGKMAPDFQGQVVQAFENLKAQSFSNTLAQGRLGQALVQPGRRGGDDSLSSHVRVLLWRRSCVADPRTARVW